MPEPTKDWDDAFANMIHIAGSDAFPAAWVNDGAAYRASGIRIDRNIAYGDRPREKLDMIWPDGPPQGLAVFIHGGYWMQSGKDDWTYLAEGARANGWAVCLPGYTLAPEARITDITHQIAAAITHAAGLVSGPVVIAGHSAGGHLAARMMCLDAGLSGPLRARTAHALCISGIYDLRPLIRTKMNTTLHLDDAEARRESPSLLRPWADVAVTVWVGGDERPEFLRQSRLLAQTWGADGATLDCVVDAGHHHFNVLDGLSDPASAITQAFIARR